MKLLNKADIVAVSDGKTFDLAVPEWGEGVGVRIKSLTVAEHKAFSAGVKDTNDDAMVASHLCVACLIDEMGNPLFTLADVSILASKSASVVKKIAKECLRVNGLSKDEEGERKNA